MTNEEIQFEDILIIGDSMDIDFKKSQKKMEQMLILQKKELLEKVEKYEKFIRKELDNADEKDLTMIAYDMHSRLVAIKHIIKKLLT